MAEVTEFSPKTAADEAESAPPTGKRKPGRPPNGTYRDPEARQPKFFDAVAAVPKEDWGTRAFMYVYADEPVCKAKTFGSTRYLLKSSAPILDLEGLKQDYGSFKGWMSLNLRKTGKDQTDERDRLDFEIYDPKCPPKIPRAAWANDSRNERWIALLPPDPPSASAAATSLMEGARFYKDIRDELKEEMQPPETPGPVDQTRSTLETMKLAKELFAPAVPATPPKEEAAAVDPWAAAEKILNMRADNPMMAILQQQMKDSAAAQEAERTRAFAAAEAARVREFELQKQLLEARNVPQKGIIEQLTELAAMGDKLEPLKKMFGFGGATETIGRAARTTALDVIQSIAQSPFGANLGQGLGMLAASLATSPNINGAPRPAPAPVVLNPQQSNGTTPPAEDAETRINRIGQMITQPMLYEFFLKDEAGDTFAERMFDMWPEDYVFMRKLGAENIVNRYRQFAPAWAIIGPKEPQFIEFVTEFCNWPGPDEDAAEPENGIVDLEEKAKGASA